MQGRAERFRDALQIAVQSIARAEGEQADPARFLPTAYRDLDELEGFLEHLAREVYDPPLKLLLANMLGDGELRAQLRRAPCSAPSSRPGPRPGVHHAYLGGLLEHTVAVATLALELCTLHPRLDRDMLLSAAIVHDIGKTREFTYGAEIARSPEGRLLGHIELGMRVLAGHMPKTLEGERRLALEHCVLLHHGAEAASGQRFASAEALALYRLNALDAQVKGAFESGSCADRRPSRQTAVKPRSIAADVGDMSDIGAPTAESATADPPEEHTEQRARPATAPGCTRPIARGAPRG